MSISDLLINFINSSSFLRSNSVIITLSIVTITLFDKDFPDELLKNNLKLYK